VGLVTGLVFITTAHLTHTVAGDDAEAT